MSYAKDVKDELSRLPINMDNSDLYELEGLLRLSSDVYNDYVKQISFYSRNPLVCKRLIQFLRNIFDLEYELSNEKDSNLNHKNLYSVNIISDVEKVIDIFSLEGDSINKDIIYNNNDFARAFLRGCFLARGSVNNPQKSAYHLEISSNYNDDAVFIQRLMIKNNLNAKISKRRNNFIIYLKDIEGIKDFLRIIGASKTVFELEEVLINKSILTNIKRSINIETANEQKILNACDDQIKDIQYLEYNYPLEKLDYNILLIMKVRKDYPESSLNDLVKILKDKYDISITKSGISHRFKKIKEIVEHFKQLSK
ncbi:MAG: DNA-binding protein WhiA [Anaeroplasmataceae bacterium]